MGNGIRTKSYSHPVSGSGPGARIADSGTAVALPRGPDDGGNGIAATAGRQPLPAAGDTDGTRLCRPGGDRPLPVEPEAPVARIPWH